MHQMTPDETGPSCCGDADRRAGHGPRDGRPHVAPVWFTLDGDDLLFNTGENTVKGANLQRDGRVALMVDDEEPPFAFVSIEGDVSLSDDLDTMRYWATRIAARYMGEDQADAYGKRNAVPGELLVRVRPTKIVAIKRSRGLAHTPPHTLPPSTPRRRG